MANIDKSISTGSGFLVKNAPLDSKVTAATLAERNSYVAQGVLYKNAIVSVEEDGHFYVYTGVAPTGEDYSACFKDLFDGIATVDGTNFTQNPTVNGDPLQTQTEVNDAIEQAFTEKTGTQVQAHSDQLDKLAAFEAEGPVVRNADGTFGTLSATGSNGISADIANGVLSVGLGATGTAGTYTKVTTDAQGRVTAGENPITLAGYGITDAVNVAGGQVGKLTYTGVDIGALSENDLVTKAYADSISLGYVPHEAARTVSLTNVAGTYADGTGISGYPGVGATFTTTTTAIGGVTLTAGQRVLIIGQTDKKQNGIYDVTSVGASVVLTRADDFDGHPTINYDGLSILVADGDHKGNVYGLQNRGNIVFGTDDIDFVETFTPTAYSAGAGISIENNTVAVKQGSIVKVINGNLEVSSGTGNAGKVLVAGADGTAASFANLDVNVIEGVLNVAKGGTGASTLPADQLMVGNGTNAVKTIAKAEGVLVGTAAGAPAFGKANLTKHVTGVLPTANGGFGTANHTEGAIVVGGAGNALAEVAPAAGVLKSTGTGAPAYGKVDLTKDVSGIAPIANGGTGASTKAQAFANLAPVAANKGDIMYYDGTQWVALAKGPTGSILAVTDDGIAYVNKISCGTF